MAQGWAQFEKTCSEVSVGELPQLLQYVKSKTTPTPTTPTPTTPVKQEIKEEEEMDIEVKEEVVDKPLVEKPIHISLGVGKWLNTDVVMATSPPQCPKQAWMPVLEVCTQRRLCCAPSVHFRCTTSIH